LKHEVNNAAFFVIAFAIIWALLSQWCNFMRATMTADWSRYENQPMTHNYTNNQGKSLV